MREKEPSSRDEEWKAPEIKPVESKSFRFIERRSSKAETDEQKESKRQDIAKKIEKIRSDMAKLERKPDYDKAAYNGLIQMLEQEEENYGRVGEGGKVMRGEEKAPELNDEEISIIKEYLSYQDAPLTKEGKSNVLKSAMSNPRTKEYADTLTKLFAGEKKEEVEKLATNMKDECGRLLGKLGVKPTPFGESKTWAVWDIAKQQYYLDNKDTATDASGYKIISPFEKNKIVEMVDRHVGWEAYEAYLKGRSSFADKFPAGELRSKILNLLLKKPKDNNTLSSKELAELGGYIRAILK